MKKCKYITDYINSIRSGKLPASKEMHQAVDYIEKEIYSESVFIDTEKINKAVELIERYFKMQLLPWELFIISLVHCYHQSNNTVVFNEFFIMMGRGNGKNGFISGLAWYLTTKYHGVPGYNVDIIANSEEQAETSFNDIYEMLESTWKKSQTFFYKSKVKILNLNTKSYIKYNTSNARTKDGKRSACLIFDEEHEYENSKTIGVFQSGFGKRKHSRIFKITTNGYVRDGVLDNDLRIAHDVLNGTITGSGICPLIYKMDDDEECKKPRLWVKANPSLPYFPELKVEMDKEASQKKYNKQVELDFFTKRMNLPRGDQEIQITEWENVAATNRKIPDLTGYSCVGGIDYASLNDIASVNLHFKVGEIRYDIGHSWLCLKSHDLWRLKVPWREWAEYGLITLVDDKEINPDLIANWFFDQAKKYNIEKIAMDNYRYALMARSLRNIGFDVQNYKNVKCIRPSDIFQIIPVIDSVFTNKKFIWGDQPLMRWAAWNTKKMRRGRIEGTDTGNFYYAKIEAKSRKTDPWMSIVHSMTLENKLDESNSWFPDIPLITW